MEQPVRMDIEWEGAEHLGLIRAMKLVADLFPRSSWLVVDIAFEEVSRIMRKDNFYRDALECQRTFWSLCTTYKQQLRSNADAVSGTDPILHELRELLPIITVSENLAAPALATPETSVHSLSLSHSDEDRNPRRRCNLQREARGEIRRNLDLGILKRKSMKLKRKAKKLEAELSELREEASDFGDHVHTLLEAAARLTMEEQPRGSGATPRQD